MNIRIVCAAVRFINFDNPDKTVTLVGARHYDSWMQAQIENLPHSDDTTKMVQGFIDQRGNFYTRTEAWKIAESEGQIIRRCGGDTKDGGTLWSENLY